jgi:hypothetical protein
MTNLTTEFTKGEFYTIYTYASDAPIFGKVIAVSAHGVKVQGYRMNTTDVPDRWVSFRSIASSNKARTFYTMNVKGK